VTQQRGKWLDSLLESKVLATVHPSSILRTPGNEARRQAMEQFVDDLRKIRKAIERLSP